MERRERVPLPALRDQLRVREERRARSRLPGDRLGGPEHEPQVLDVQVVEADVVDVLGTQAHLGQRLVGVVPDRGQDLVGEELAEPLDLLRVIRRLRGAFGHGGLVGEGPELAVEVLELNHLEAVDDVDEGIRGLGGAPEGELERIPGRCNVHRPNGAHTVLGRGEPGAKLGRGLPDRGRPIAARPGLVGRIELVERLQADLFDLDLGNLDDRHRAPF